MPPQTLDLISRPNAEARTHGHGRDGADSRQIVEHRLWDRHAFTGGAGHGDRIHETLARGTDPGQTLRHRHRGHHLHERHTLLGECRAKLIALVKRQIRNDESAHPGRRSILRESCVPILQ